MRLYVFISLFLTCYVTTNSQTAIPKSLNPNEAVTFDVNFKWGLIMTRAGEAVISFKRDSLVRDASWRYQLLFKTTKFYDNFFTMRDTLSSFYNDESQIVFSSKRTDDGGYYSIDELSFTYEDLQTKIHSIRYTKTRVKIDTMLICDSFVTDMLGAFFYLRGINRLNIKSGDVFNAITAIGRDLIKISFNYHGRTVIDRGGEKYNTCYFKVDIHDSAFESSHAAAEVWVSDDDNFIPVKIRSKLKIGYAEIYYKSASSLAHPFSSKISN